MARKKLKKKSSAPIKFKKAETESGFGTFDIICDEWIDEETYMQIGEGFEITYKVDQEGKEIIVVFSSEFGCFTDVQAFKEFFEGFVERITKSMESPYQLDGIYGHAMFDAACGDMWNGTWEPGEEIKYENFGTKMLNR